MKLHISDINNFVIKCSSSFKTENQLFNLPYYKLKQYLKFFLIELEKIKLYHL